ncbi:hypothetical protein PMAYCL1PPCAC_19513, partial [Pristionchus mayeri]
FQDEVKEESEEESPSFTATDGSLEIECSLEGRELWEQFYDVGTEMIVTKSGRRMFPTVKVSVRTNDTVGILYVFLDIVPADQKRYRYFFNKSCWKAVGDAERSPKARLLMHPSSPFTRDQLQNDAISFEKAKLTNNIKEQREGHFIIKSMHKYQPRVHIVRRDKNNPIHDPLTVRLSKESYRSFVFEKTQFVGVTAYQNQLITKLKIVHNPFAKGFRDSGERNSDYESGQKTTNTPLLPPS